MHLAVGFRLDVVDYTSFVLLCQRIEHFIFLWDFFLNFSEARFQRTELLIFDRMQETIAWFRALCLINKDLQLKGSSNYDITYEFMQ